jgi:FtsP/CotA-like multicopper oxidase with cupredoxin domain
MPTLTAQAGTAQLAPAGYAKTAILGFEGRVPGPTLRARQGSWLERRVVNRLDMPTSVHWHGVRLENGMDGVSGLTQAPIAPGDSFAYRFPLQDAGTFWYHAHHRSYMQVAQGLYGALIVDEPERPDIDADEALLIDDWRLDPETVQIRADFDNRHDHSHAGRLGNLVTVNGAFTHEGATPQNSRLRLRLINAANARVFRLGVQGMSAWVMALDGMPVAQPWPLNQPIDLAPGQRVDLFADITAAPGTQAHLVDIAQNGEGWALASWTAQTGGTRLPRPAPQPLPENPQMAVPAIDTAR